MAEIAVYLGLFATAFVAATLLPAQSELLLAALLIAGEQPPWLLVAVACVGNSLGSAVNWLLGRHCLNYAGRRWFPKNTGSLRKAEDWYRRYGRWSLLASWVPVIGDPLTLAAGMLREPFWSFIVLVVIAKLGRYIAVAALALQWA